MHKEKYLKNSNFITDAVIGLYDGVTVPLALVAAFL
jgi:hypothetical protein